MKTRLALAGLLAGILMATGCTPEIATPTTTGVAPPPPPPPPLATKASTPDNDTTGVPGSATIDPAQGTSVEIMMSDTGIQMPSALPAGSLGFKIDNTGKVKHGLEIKGGDVDKKLDAPIDPGATQTLQVELKTGLYQVLDPDNPKISSQLEVK